MTEEKQLTPAQIAFKKELDCYNKLHDFFSQEHGLILTTSEMDDVLKACDSFKKQWDGLLKDTMKDSSQWYDPKAQEMYSDFEKRTQHQFKEDCKNGKI